MSARTIVRRTAALVAAASLGAAMGCASLRTLARSYDVADDGLQRQEHDLRMAMDARAFDSALVRVRNPDGAAPRDELLRSMYGGLVAYYAGAFDASAHDLDQAANLAEDRWTKSVTRGAAALATNDMALDYMPGRTERLLVHYYAMLGYLQRDSAEAAAVEARRLSRLLDQFADGRDPREAKLHGTLHYLAGTAFEAAGQRTDADVSYRNATLLLADSSSAAPAVAPIALADSVHAAPTRPVKRSALAARPPARPAPVVAAPPTGDVVVVVEWGFVAHRVQHDFAMAVDSGQLSALALGSTADRDGDRSALAGVMRQIDRREHETYENERWRDGHSHRRGHSFSLGDDDDDMLYVAWPALERPLPAAGPAGLMADSGTVVPLRAQADLSDAASADYARDRAAVITRAIARAAVKYAATHVAKKKGGDVAHVLVGASSLLLERADTRSWQLLPGEVGTVRLTLPAGVHRLAIDMPGASGGRIDLGEVTVVPGRVRVTAVRLWRDGPAVAGVPIGPAATAVAATAADSTASH